MGKARIGSRAVGRDYERIERAIKFIDEHYRAQPPLKELAAREGLSEYHFQRLFRRFAGISPERFLTFLTAEHGRTLLRESGDVLDRAFEAGSPGPGRHHGLSVKIHAATPGEVKGGGAGLTIRYGFHPSPFGECLVAISERGVCRLTFIPGEGPAGEIADLRKRWPKARFIEEWRGTRHRAEQIFSTGEKGPGAVLDLHVKGSSFQIRVWEALLKVPPGCVISYGDLAGRAGFPGASRAVGTAVGSNPVAYLIPCHRVIRATGAFGNYGGGRARKKAILAWEAAGSCHGE